MSVYDERSSAPRVSRKVRKLMHEIRTKRGFENERRFFNSFESSEGVVLPHWWLSIRKATPIEDRKLKIDAVLMTDVGKIYFQIKSSESMARAFGQVRRMRHIIPLVISGPLHTPGEIRALVLREASRYRDQLIAERGNTMATD